MHEQIGGSVDRGQLPLRGDVPEPGNGFCASRQITELLPLGTIADHQQMKTFWVSSVQNLKGSEQSFNFLFMGEPAYIEKQKPVGRDLHTGAGGASIFSGPKDISVDPELRQNHIFYPPFAQHLAKR